MIHRVLFSLSNYKPSDCLIDNSEKTYSQPTGMREKKEAKSGIEVGLAAYAAVASEFPLIVKVSWTYASEVISLHRNQDLLETNQAKCAAPCAILTHGLRWGSTGPYLLGAL